MPKLKTGLALYMGVDPGKSGGIAYIDEDRRVTYEPMPSRLIDTRNIFQNAKTLDAGYKRTTFVVLEQVHSMPNQSAQSGFTFGRGFGNLEMAIVAAGLSYDEVPPQRWMKALGIATVKGSTPAQRKEALRKKCQMLFPDLSLWQETKKLQLAVCDAILIAEYARRTY